MRVFVTGATGFIGTAVVHDLIAAGHQVIGLARSDPGGRALADAGAEVRRGTLADPECLRKGCADADGVIHLAFDHDFSRFVDNCEADRRVIETLGSALAGSNRPLIVTSGIVTERTGQTAVETDSPVSSAQMPRAASEEAAAAVSARGGNVSVVRLPQVHNTVRQGLVSFAIAIAREKNVAAYVGDGHQRWPAVHLSDTARLYRLALERGHPGARYHAVAEEGIPLRDIAAWIGRIAHVPVASVAAEQAGDYLDWLAPFAGRDAPAASRKTRQWLDWEPTGPGLLADLEQMATRMQSASG